MPWKVPDWLPSKKMKISTESWMSLIHVYVCYIK